MPHLLVNRQIIVYSAIYQRCKVCSIAKSKKKTPNLYIYRKKWKGYAIAMELDMVVELLRSTKKREATVTTLIRDDDTTAFNIAKMRSVLT